MNPVPALVAVLASSLALGGCCAGSVIVTGPRATATEEITVEPGAAVALSVETSAGNIRVAPADGERGPVTVTATKSTASEEDLAKVHCFARVEGETVLVGYTTDPGVKGVAVSFSVRAPAMARTRLRTSAGNLEVTGAAGSVEARTSAGNVEVSGDLRGDCVLRSSAGNLEVALPSTSRLRVEGSTNAGNARSDLPIGASRNYAAATLAGTLGDGADGTLEMRTSAGNLEVRALR